MERQDTSKESTSPESEQDQAKRLKEQAKLQAKNDRELLDAMKRTGQAKITAKELPAERAEKAQLLRMSETPIKFRSCNTCIFYHSRNQSNGECRRHAPSNAGVGGKWCQVTYLDWCGELRIQNYALLKLRKEIENGVANG